MKTVVDFENDLNYFHAMTTNFWGGMKLNQAFVRTELSALGVSFRRIVETNEYRVARRDDPSSEYFTDDLQDALDTGRAMSGNPRVQAIND